MFLKGRCGVCVYIYTRTHMCMCIYIYENESEVAQSCPALCDPMDCGLPGSSVHGIFQARVLEWVAISFSSAWKCKVKVKSLSRVRLFMTPWTVAYQAPLSMGFSRQEYWSGLPLPSLILTWVSANSTTPSGLLIWENHCQKPSFSNLCHVKIIFKGIKFSQLLGLKLFR